MIVYNHDYVLLGCETSYNIKSQKPEKNSQADFFASPEVFCMWPCYPGRFVELWKVTRIGHSNCVDNGLVVSKDAVRHLLSILDPDGVDRRRRRRLQWQCRLYRGVGPNFTWHIDCYDRLKPYCVCISGCKSSIVAVNPGSQLVTSSSLWSMKLVAHVVLFWETCTHSLGELTRMAWQARRALSTARSEQTSVSKHCVASLESMV